jgi:hypothetical protein
MAWTEAQIDELINNVRRDFALGRLHRRFAQKLHEHSVTIQDAEKAIGKHSYIGQYESEKGKAIGFLNPRNNIFVASRSDVYPSYIKTCFVADDGVDYLFKQEGFELIWSPK